MKAIAKISTISILSASLFASSLSAQCININKVDVNWTSFKTLSKIGVSGTFKDVKLETKTNASTTKEALLNSSVKINMKEIDAKADIKTNNILKYFVANLENEEIEAKIINVYDKTLDLVITLNGTTKTIPMKYIVRENNIVSSGVIDALDFNLAPALKILNTKVAGHLNKGWYDIPVGFELAYNSTCL